MGATKSDGLAREARPSKMLQRQRGRALFACANCFETMFISEAMGLEKNKRVPSKGSSMSCGEFVRWSGVWLLVRMMNKSLKHELLLFSNLKEVDQIQRTLHRVNYLMAGI